MCKLTSHRIRKMNYVVPIRMQYTDIYVNVCISISYIYRQQKRRNAAFRCSSSPFFLRMYKMHHIGYSGLNIGILSLLFSFTTDSSYLLGWGFFELSHFLLFVSRTIVVYGCITRMCAKGILYTGRLLLLIRFIGVARYVHIQLNLRSFVRIALFSRLIFFHCKIKNNEIFQSLGISFFAPHAFHLFVTSKA